MNIAEKIISWADKLRDIAANGLYYAENSYDQDRYVEIRELSVEMAVVGSENELEAFEEVKGTIWSRATPYAAAETAVIDEQGRILLIQRGDTKTWALPGGALEVGETPSEGAMRETFEETGYRAEPIGLVGVFDNRFHNTPFLNQVYILLFLGKLIPDQVVEKASHEHEILDQGWFLDAELDQLDMIASHRARAREGFRLWGGDQTAHWH